MKREYLLAVFIVLIAVGFMFFRPGEPEQIVQDTPPTSSPQDTAEESSSLPDLPQQTVEMALVSQYSGDAAMRDILALHHNDFPLEDGLIAHYQGDTARGTVWVSVSPDEAEAALLMQLMIQELPASPVFKEEDVFQLGDHTIYYVTGMGQDHYYWLDDIYVYWLAVTSENPIDELNVFLEN